MCLPQKVGNIPPALRGKRMLTNMASGTACLALAYGMATNALRQRMDENHGMKLNTIEIVMESHANAAPFLQLARFTEADNEYNKKSYGIHKGKSLL
jgi:hypothetical protein